MLGKHQLTSAAFKMGRELAKPIQLLPMYEQLSGVGGKEGLTHIFLLEGQESNCPNIKEPKLAYGQPRHVLFFFKGMKL